MSRLSANALYAVRTFLDVQRRMEAPPSSDARSVGSDLDASLPTLVSAHTVASTRGAAVVVVQ